MTVEEWRPVPGHEDYEVSNRGQVMSHKKATPRLLRPIRKQNGYLAVSLLSGGQRETRRIHTLVAEAFLGPREAGLQVRHLDGSRDNNTLENLAWGSAAENAQDAIEHGTHFRGSKTHCKSGHPFDDANTYMVNGSRHCRACNLAAVKRYQIRRALRAAGIASAA